MNFFEHQDVTRRNTKFLVFLFWLAVVIIIGLVYFAAVTAYYYMLQRGMFSGGGSYLQRHQVMFRDVLWQPKMLLYSVLSTLGVITIGSLYMTHRLSKGGAAVAELLGGVVVLPGTKEPHERKLLNVVEEMAIASGVPMPAVYLLYEEESINAFAAGFSPSDAAIGVSKGCIQLLTRDELQGVIAHEFSHILNGDMRLNIRLTGVLHGILFIALIGYFLLRGSSVRRTSFSRGGFAWGAIVGISLLVIGYTGVFFGKLIKSAVSRQREFLADASAVQFTRNPAGISGALKKIGGFSTEGRIKHPNAETVSHMFFGNALKPSFLNALSTHPPLTDRIKRIDPHFKGNFAKTKGIPLETTTVDASSMGFAQNPKTKSVLASDVTKLIGNPSTKHLLFAGTFLRNLPTNITKAAHEPFGACAIVYAILISEDEEIKTKQWQVLKASADPLVLHHTKTFSHPITSMGEKARLPLIDLALPALRTLSPQQYNQFTRNVMALMKTDGQMDIFEFVLIKILKRHLTPHFAKADKKKVHHRTLGSVFEEIRKLLSAVAYAGTSNDLEAERAFEKGMKKLGASPAEIVPSKDFRVTDLNKVLDKLSHASPSLKKEILEAAIESIVADREVKIGEAELLRAIGDSLDCPIPPILI